MKKIILLFAVVAIAFFSCGNKNDSKLNEDAIQRVKDMRLSGVFRKVDATFGEVLEVVSKGSEVKWTTSTSKEKCYVTASWDFTDEEGEVTPIVVGLDVHNQDNGIFVVNVKMNGHTVTDADDRFMIIAIFYDYYNRATGGE